mmetsp:Transcript_135456/g.433221  ORF Transcript_135456/g.433221 Transcript_135456/m.433221 type:complete len:141 (+) Transcript_135456:501-923(+)
MQGIGLPPVSHPVGHFIHLALCRVAPLSGGGSAPPSRGLALPHPLELGGTWTACDCWQDKILRVHGVERWRLHSIISEKRHSEGPHHMTGGPLAPMRLAPAWPVSPCRLPHLNVLHVRYVFYHFSRLGETRVEIVPASVC